MKKSPFIWLLYFLCLFGITIAALGQDIDFSKETVVTRFSIFPANPSYDTTVFELLDTYTRQGLMMQNRHEGAGQIADSTYKLITERLKNEKGFNLLPNETLSKVVTYTRQGFPFASISKAAKKTDYQQFVDISLKIELIPTQTKVLEPTFKTFESKAVIKISLKYGDEKGKKIKTITGGATEEGIVRSFELKVVPHPLIEGQDVEAWVVKLTGNETPVDYYLMVNASIDDLLNNL